MTEREAIEWLKGCVVSYEVDNKGKPNGNITCDLTQEVLDMAISALEKQEQDRWIPVTERLPKNKKKVLVSYDTEDGKKVDISMFDKYGCLLGLVSAWRPLPEAFEAEEES